MINLPTKSYGVLERHSADSSIELAAEELKNLGFAVLDSGLDTIEVSNLSNLFDVTYKEYVEKFGAQKLRDLNEIHVMRAPMFHGDHSFIKLALNKNLIELIKLLIKGKFILNQQNGIINPPKEVYSQSKWHRDLPYQHFTSSRPLALNALFCIDDFNAENGATFVLPGSQKMELFPSEKFIMNNSVQLEAKAGSFIILDSMIYHAGGANNTTATRRGVNHVFTIPYFKQQINIPLNLSTHSLSEDERDVLGFNFMEPSSIEAFFDRRSKG